MNINTIPHSATILVIDDNPINLQVVFEYLQACELEISIAQTGIAGIERAITIIPDLILLDIQLPDIDGFETCRRLKLNEATTDIPVIFITAQADSESLVKGFSVGAVDYITKPIQQQELLARLQTHLNLQQLQKQLEQQVKERTTELINANARLEDEIHERKILNAALDQAAESIIITDTEGVIIYVNRAFEQITGYSTKEAIGKKPNMLKSNEQALSLYKDLWKTITDKKIWLGRLINKRKDGSFYTETATISPVLDENNVIINYIGVKRDITEELKLQKQYHQSQKMESVGLLAGGVAHDFNNILTAINGYAELSKLELPSESPVQSMLDIILSSGKRATSLIRQLLAFSRKEITAPTVLSLDKIVTDMDKMLEQIIGKQVKIKTIYPPELWSVKVDQSQAESIIVNLAVNARDAMPEGGLLTIELSNKKLGSNVSESYIKAKPGDYVLLSVTDTGSGMSRIVKDRLFEPFFTTKVSGKGTGLGLAAVFGIVTHSKGALCLHTKEGVGTTFEIYLPRVIEDVTLSDTGQQVKEMCVSGNETILLFEDDKNVLHVMKKAIELEGFNVLEARDGHDALEIASNYDKSIDLLLTNVTLPKMNGKKLAKNLMEIFPNVKTIFTSGALGRTIEQGDEIEKGDIYLQKPFSIHDLTQKIKEVLHQ